MNNMMCVAMTTYPLCDYPHVHDCIVCLDEQAVDYGENGEEACDDEDADECLGDG